MKGKVFLVGAGPGDPELLTLKALKAIEGAGAVVYDRLVSDAILALIPRGVPRFFAGKSCPPLHPPRKRGGQRGGMTQEEIHALLIALAREGKRVVRLKGGDPFLFGRGGEEALELAKHHVDFEIIPGITSAQGCAAYAGIPLTHRGLAAGVRFITGHRETPPPTGGKLGGGRSCSEDKSSAPEQVSPHPNPPPMGKGINFDWPSLADPDTTLVVYMGLANLGIITEKLMEHGLPADTPAAAIAHGTTPQQRVIISTLEKIEAAVATVKLEPPALVVIGKVAALAQELRWFTPQNEENIWTWRLLSQT